MGGVERAIHVPTGLRRFYVATALVLAVAGLVSMALMQPVVGTRTDLSMYNTNWDGTSQLAADLYGSDALVPGFSVSLQDDRAQVAHRSFASFQLDPASSTVLVLGPTKAPSAEEARWLAGFVEAGGRLVVADDFGSGNAFLEAAGAETRIDGRLVADLAFAKQPHFVVTSEVASHPLTQGVDELVLDYASVLEPGPRATVVASTEDSAWLDTDQDASKQPDEIAGPFPLIAVEPVGAGSVAVVSDPSLFINGMQEVADNSALTDGLVAWSVQGDRRVLIDEAHRGYPDPVRFMGVELSSLPTTWRNGLSLAAMAGFLTVAIGRPQRWTRTVLSWLREPLQRLFPPPEEPRHNALEVVMGRHPQWRQSTLEDILVGWREADDDREARGGASDGP